MLCETLTLEFTTGELIFGLGFIGLVILEVLLVLLALQIKQLKDKVRVLEKTKKK